MMIEAQLEDALVTYLASYWKNATDALQSCKLVPGRTSNVEDTAERVVIDAGERGGPHAEEGNYQVELAIVVITSAHKSAAGDQPELRHEARVAALGAIFTLARRSAVANLLTAIDPALGCSGYQPLPLQRGNTATEFRTVLPFIFHVHTPAVPVYTVAPVLDDLELIPGDTVNCDTGTWTPTPTGYSYQWYSSSILITGATSASYVIPDEPPEGQVFPYPLVCYVTALHPTGDSIPRASNAAVVSEA